MNAKSVLTITERLVRNTVKFHRAIDRSMSERLGINNLALLSNVSGLFIRNV